MLTKHIWDSCLPREATCKEGVWNPGGWGWHLKGIEMSLNTPLWPKYFIQDRRLRCQAPSKSNPFGLIGWSCQALFHISSFTSLLLFILNLWSTFWQKPILLFRTSWMVVFDPLWLRLVKNISVLSHADLLFLLITHTSICACLMVFFNSLWLCLSGVFGVLLRVAFFCFLDLGSTTTSVLFCGALLVVYLSRSTPFSNRASALRWSEILLLVCD